MHLQYPRKRSDLNEYFCRLQRLALCGCLLFLFCSISNPYLEPVDARSKVSKKKRTSKKSTSKKRRSSKSRRSSRSRKKAKPKPKPKPKPAPLTEEQKAANAKKESNLSSMKAGYMFFDAGMNAKASGDYKLAKAKLHNAITKLDQATSHQKSSHEGTMTALVYYELGMVSELDGDYLTAKDSYAKCLRVRPSYTQASVKLVNLLAKFGHLDLAEVKAKEAVKNNPKDPRAHMLLALLAKKKGESEVLQRAEQEAARLMSVEAQIIPKHNARQKNVTRVVDYLNKPDPDLNPLDTQAKPHDEAEDSDTMVDEESDQNSESNDSSEDKPKSSPAKSSGATSNPKASSSNQAASTPNSSQSNSNQPPKTSNPSKRLRIYGPGKQSQSEFKPGTGVTNWAPAKESTNKPKDLEPKP